MAKPKLTLEGPQRAKVQAALARRTRGTRTLATLQSHLTADVTRQVLDTLTAIIRGTETEHELPQKEGPSSSFVRKSRRSSGYRGAIKSGAKWLAQIQRGGVKTHLGSYKEELTAAVVFQAVDREYSKVGFPRRTAPCTCAQPAETYNAPAQELSPPMASRPPSTYHLETLAENRRLEAQVQTLKKDIRELWSILHRAYGNWKR